MLPLRKLFAGVQILCVLNIIIHSVIGINLIIGVLSGDTLQHALVIKLMHPAECAVRRGAPVPRHGCRIRREHRFDLSVYQHSKRHACIFVKIREDPTDFFCGHFRCIIPAQPECSLPALLRFLSVNHGEEADEIPAFGECHKAAEPQALCDHAGKRPPHIVFDRIIIRNTRAGRERIERIKGKLNGERAVLDLIFFDCSQNLLLRDRVKICAGGKEILRDAAVPCNLIVPRNRRDAEFPVELSIEAAGHRRPVCGRDDILFAERIFYFAQFNAVPRIPDIRYDLRLQIGIIKGCKAHDPRIIDQSELGEIDEPRQCIAVFLAQSGEKHAACTVKIRALRRIAEKEAERLLAAVKYL